MALSNNGKLLVSIDVDGYGIVIDLQNQKLVENYQFGGKVDVIVFSKCDKFIAVAQAKSKNISIIKTPDINKSSTAMSL